MRRRKVVNYLSNHELLKEIHKSKASYCEFIKPEYSNYDQIVESLENVNFELAKETRAKRLNDLEGDRLFELGKMTNKQIDTHLLKHGLKANDIKTEDLVIRLLTTEHIPNIVDKQGRTKKSPVNFPPFQHFILIDNKWMCVGKSHSNKGKFDTEHGRTTRNLAVAYMTLVERYGRKGNWRNYTYLDEMKGYSTVRLCQVGLTFNEFRTSNPFAYFTQIVMAAFTYILNKEKEAQSTKSKLMQDIGYDASFSSQAEKDQENYLRDNAPVLVKSD